MAKRVSIVMGSDSDLPVMEKAAGILQEFGIGYEMRVLSAHRTPDETSEYARTAAGRGFAVIIAGAGMSAALPGVVAAQTELPVIGVPVYGQKLGGVDALYAIAQMPPGVPVASVGIDAAVNAALLAVRILALSDPELVKKLEAYRDSAREKVLNKDRMMQEKAAE